MIRKNRFNNHGFSLVELLIVMGMLLLVLTAVYSVYTAQQRSVVVQDDVVEVQQNLRIGMDQMTRDFRMAGYLACPSPISGGADLPVNDLGPGTSDTVTVLIASGTSRSAVIDEKPGITSSIVTFQLETPEDVDKFAGEESARIVSPQVKGIVPAKRATGLYPILSADRVAKTVTLSGLALDAAIERGDMLLTAQAAGPSKITYCLGSATAGACQAPMCPANQNCLVRIENGISSTVASNMAGLQFRYLLKDFSEVDSLNASTVVNVRAVRITASGRTSASNAVSGGAKTRQMASLVDLRNAEKPCP